MVIHEFILCLVNRTMSISPGKVDRVKPGLGDRIEIVALFPM